jgi:hypothetical protein
MGDEATAKELPPLGLADALELSALIARKAPRRHPRVRLGQFVDADGFLEVWDLSIAETPKRWRTGLTLK